MAKTVRLSSKRQIAIPRALCEKVGIRIGGELVIEESYGRLILWPKPKSYSDALEGLGREIWEGVDPLEYIRKERASWDKRPSPQR